MGNNSTWCTQNCAQLIQNFWVGSADNRGLSSPPADEVAHKHDRVSQALWHPILKTLTTIVSVLLLRCYGSNDGTTRESWLTGEGTKGSRHKVPFLKQSTLSSETREEKTQQWRCTHISNLTIKAHLRCLHAPLVLSESTIELALWGCGGCGQPFHGVVCVWASSSCINYLLPHVSS